MTKEFFRLKLYRMKRNLYGKKSSIIAIVCNALLCAAKLAVGILFNVTAIVADAFNNLSDFGSNAVSLIGFAVADKPADKEHPFGHARAEYIGALIVSFVVIFLGIELIITAIENIITPSVSVFSWITVAVLVASIAVKLFLFLYNRTVGKKIDSVMLKAVATDSLFDCIATFAVLIAVIVGKYVSINVDPYMTIIVAVLILFAGVKLVIETTSDLLGKAPTTELVKEIKEKILSYPDVLGVHDLSVHDYGHGKVVASAHVEVDSKIPILQSHDTIDLIERSFSPDIMMTIHLDPIVIDDPVVNELHQKVVSAVKQIDENVSVHDFRVVFGTTHSNLIFDVSVPFDCKIPPETIKNEIDAKVKQIDSTYNTVVTVDRE